jgi:L-alanine-DL-glutamate epimerase-like enolase superfamily enzyme
MKITRLTTRLLAVEAGDWYGQAPLPKGERRTWEFPLTTVETDEGFTGHTMAYGKQMEGRAIACLIRDIYAPRMVDEDPLHHEALWQRLKHKNRDLRNVTDAVLGMLDVALWDIKGKAAGLPIAVLLGLYRTAVPSYATASRFLATPEQVFAEARRVQAQGFRGYKLQIWDGPARDIPRLRAAREAVGPGFPLMHDAVAGYHYVEALRVGRALEELDYTWFEEPISDRQIGLLRRLAAELRVPILAAEGVGVDELAEYLRHDALDLVRGDVHAKGGISGLRKALALCELFGLHLEIHTASTPLLDVANLHVACSVRNCDYLESHQPLFRFGLVGDPLAIDAEGCLRMPEGPGLGVTLDWDWIEDHTLEVI